MIKINDKFSFDSDEYNWVLYEHRTSISKKTGEKVINTKNWYPSTLDYLCEMVINDAPKTAKDLNGVIQAIEQAKDDCIMAIQKIPYKHTHG